MNPTVFSKDIQIIYCILISTYQQRAIYCKMTERYQGSRRLEIMERVEKTIDEELDHIEDIFDAKDESSERRQLIEDNHIEEDEDYLYNLERFRQCIRCL